MRRFVNRLLVHVSTFLLGLLIFTGVSTSVSYAPEGANAPNSPRNRVEEVYTPFDTLRTDLGDYIWPTNASTVITSTFADYRRTHLHEGIDISTNNQTGYPVYASRTGYVSRIFVSRRGYGKMLFVRHPDGFVTMYAHLQRFQTPLETYAKRLQKENKKYSLEVDLDPSFYPVSKGDLIGYTGSTGTGGAHLHFEVRDSALNPINPFLLPQISSAVNDEVAPQFVTVAFTPLSKSSKAQGRSKAWTVNANKESEGEYTLTQPVELSGLIGVSVRATDQADVLKYRTGAFSFEMSVDGRVVFTSAKKFIGDSEGHQVAVYYDKSLLRARKGRFEKLYIEDGNRLPFYNRSPEGTGLLVTSELGPGEHQLRIVAWDQSGNESILTGLLSIPNPPTR